MVKDMHTSKGSQKIQKKGTQNLKQTELPGVTPKLKAALKKFRKDGKKAERAWLKPLPLKQTTLDKSFFTVSKAQKDSKDICTET